MEPLKPEDPPRIGPFMPLARIGAGGMGRVYLARSRGGRPVAVKVIRAEYAEDERFRTRFRREVDAARNVNGLYTAPVLDAGPDDDEPWLATAYIPGPSLQRVVHDHGPLPERSARVLGAGIAEALGAIHGAGLIHRDLKPSNVICGPDGPRVIDFGISHSIDAAGTNLTSTGVIVGSPRYASPEQCRADPEMLPASDIFALGGVLVFATTGIPPFGEGPDHVQLYLVVHEQPDLAAVPAGLRPIAAACLEKNPANRPSIDELLDTLLPPDDAAPAAAVDWLPEAVHRDLRDYAAAPATVATEAPTHERPEHDPVRTPGAPSGAAMSTDRTGFSGRVGGPTYAPSAPPTPPGPSAYSAQPTPPPAPNAKQTPHPTRRRVITGVAGLVAMAASGGGAWYAATRHEKKAAQASGGPTPPATTPTASGGQNLATGTSAPPTTASTSASSPPSPHATGKYGEDWLSSTDFGGAAGGAVVRGDKLFGVYTATSNNPNPQQSLVALDTVTGKGWNPVNIPSVDAVTGSGLAVDDQYVYSYGVGTVHAYSIKDGTQAWAKKGVLAVSTQTNAMPVTGILGLVDGVLIIGAPNVDPSTPTCLAGVDVATQTVVWTHKPSDLMTNFPADAADVKNSASISIWAPREGNRFYVTLTDMTSVRVLKGMDPKTGKELWHAPFTRRSENNAGTLNPTVTGTAGHVYLTDMHSGSVHTYDTSGTWKWTHPDPEAPNHVTVPSEQRFTGPVVEADGVVYATNSRSVIALDTSSTTAAGSTIWAQPKQFNGLSGTAPVVVGDKIWVEVHTPSQSAGLALAVLNRSDGQPVNQYPMPPGPNGSSADLLISDPAVPALYVLTAAGQVLGYRRAQ